MLNDFFVNLLLLVAVTFVGGHILKELSVKKLNTILTKIIIGIVCGFVGILLIVYAVSIKEADTLVDLRVYAIMIASYVGGIIPTIISGIMIAVFRLSFCENQTSYVVVIIQIVSFVVTYYIIDKITKTVWKRWLFKTAISILILVSSYYILLRNVEDVQWILIQYISMVIVAGVLEYFLLDYVRTFNELYRKYKHDSTKDFLTGLTNTRQFDNKLNMAYERVTLSNETLTCLMVDIDFFKKINDTYGHAIGDLVLKELAEILKKSIRSTDVIARVGGEEFCALLFNCTREQSFEIALNINKAVMGHQFPIGDNEFTNITVSVGLSMYPEMTANLDTLKELADTALYQAKRNGRNRVCDNDRCLTNIE